MPTRSDDTPHVRARRYGSCRLAFDGRGGEGGGVSPKKREREKKGDRKYSIERTKVKGAERNAMDGLSLSPFYTNFSFFVCIFGSFEFLFFPLSLSSFY